MRRLTAKDYAVDAVTAAKALVGAWLCRRFDDGTVIRRRRRSYGDMDDDATAVE